MSNGNKNTLCNKSKKLDKISKIKHSCTSKDLASLTIEYEKKQLFCRVGDQI